MQLAGLEGQQVVLLLEDYQFVHSAFLEMVNSLLSSGVSCCCVCCWYCMCVFSFDYILIKNKLTVSVLKVVKVLF